MAPLHTLCCIVPEHILRGIVQKGRAPQYIINACRTTIDKTTQIQDARVQQGQSIASARQQHVNQGIVPPYIHDAIARHAVTAEQHEVSTRTLEHDAQIRAAARSERRLQRTVYDAQHSWDFDRPPRDKVMIDEGGAVVSEVLDPSKDANECYAGFEKTYNFFFDHFGRDSVDGEGLALDGFVHFGVGYRNAFWDGKRMVFGEGDGVIFNGFTDELDVIAHELTHGVVQHMSPLKYRFQSGALNESLADVFGVMVKQCAEDPQHPQDVQQANWLIGEGIWAKGINGKALRDMKNPGTAYDDPNVGKDPQPAHWTNFQKLEFSEDRGGVHINSGIPNHAFYLAATMIGGFAWEGAGPIWYRALKSGQLSEDATFREFADLTIEHAGEHVGKVRVAWQQVGYPFSKIKVEL